MKRKLRRILITTILFSGLSAWACPVWLVGYVKIVDETGKVLKDAKLWYVYGANDSALRSRAKLDIEDSVYLDKYSVYTGGGSWDEIPGPVFREYYRVQCDGFTDVVIKDIEFTRKKSSWPGRNAAELPTLNIVMYKSQFIQKGDYFIKLNEYVVDEVKVDSDSTVVNIKQYTHDLINESVEATIERALKSPYLSYPNPVKDKITVEVKDSMPQPLKVKVYDLAGKVVFEADHTESKLEYDLSVLAAGSYFIRIETQEGEMKYCRKFVKG